MPEIPILNLMFQSGVLYHCGHFKGNNLPLMSTSQLNENSLNPKLLLRSKWCEFHNYIPQGN